MNISQSLKFPAIAILFTACVSAPPLQQPIANGPAINYELYRPPVLEQTSHMFQHLDADKNIVYFQSYGGNVGVGVLLGPLGVAANIKMIESNTMQDVALLKSKIAVNPQAIFVATAAKQNIVAVTGSSVNVPKISPYLLVENTEGHKLMLASVILIERVNPTKNQLPNRYLVQLPITYSVAELSALDATRKQQLEVLIANGFDALIAKIKSEASANVAAEEKITVQSEFLTPRFKFDQTATLIEKTGEITWIRTTAAVCGIRNSDLTYKVAKK
jgi:hypothetical protein